MWAGGGLVAGGLASYLYTRFAAPPAGLPQFAMTRGAGYAFAGAPAMHVPGSRPAGLPQFSMTRGAGAITGGSIARGAIQTSLGRPAGAVPAFALTQGAGAPYASAPALRVRPSGEVISQVTGGSLQRNGLGVLGLRSSR